MPGEIPRSESSLSSIGIHASGEVPNKNGTEQPDSDFSVMESSLRNASDIPSNVQEEHTTISATSTSSPEIDQTEKDNQMEGFQTRGIDDDSYEHISQKTDSVDVSHIHVEDESVHPTTYPKIGDSGNGHLESPGEISLPSLPPDEHISQKAYSVDVSHIHVEDEHISQKTDSVGVSHIHVEDKTALPTTSDSKIGVSENGHLESPGEFSFPPDEQISQKTGFVGVSHIHVEDESALPMASDPKIEDSENDHLEFPSEISLPPDEQSSQMTDFVGISHIHVENESALPSTFDPKIGVFENGHLESPSEISLPPDEQISQKTDHVVVSHIHVEDESALPTTSDPKIGVSENGCLESPGEISLPLDEQISQKTDFVTVPYIHVDDGSVIPATFDPEIQDSKNDHLESLGEISSPPDEQISQKTRSVGVSHIHVEERNSLLTPTEPKIGVSENGHLESPESLGQISLPLEEQISQKTGSIDVSYIHVNDGSVLPNASNPKIVDSENGHIGSSGEISLPHVDVNGVVFGSSNCVTDRQQSENGHLVCPGEVSLPSVDVEGVALESRNYVTDGHQSESVHSASFESKSNLHVKPPSGLTKPHLKVAIVAAGSSQDAASVSSCHYLIDDNISSTPKDNNSKAEDAIKQMNNHSLRHLKITSSIDDSPRYDSARFAKQFDISRIHIDTTAPFDSVKEAVSKFGEIADWKAHRKQAVERRMFVERHLEKMQLEIPEYKKQLEDVEETKMQVLKELESTKRQVEELKLSLEKAQTEENQARQDSELAKLRVQEMEQGIVGEASVAAKAQLEVAKARHSHAVSELISINEELETLRKDYSSLITERDVAVKKAEEAISASKEIEKMVEKLSIELIATKEALDSTHAAHLEAEDKKIGATMAREQDTHFWEKEVKLAEEEVQSLTQQIQSTKDMKLKLDIALALLVDLKAELADYKENKNRKELDRHSNDSQTSETHDDIQDAVASAKKELEEVKINIEKVTAEVDCLKVSADSLKSELEKEKTALATLKQREGMASVVVASLEAELDKSHTEIAVVQATEKETREKMEELPKQLQKAAQEADEAKSLTQIAREEFCKAKEEAEQAKATASVLDSKLLAAQKEIQAAKASQKLALAAINALRKSESARQTENANSPGGVVLPIDEYHELNKRAHEAEEQATLRVEAFISQIEQAKQSKSKSTKKLEEVKQEMAERKEALRSAMKKAEKARQGKLAVEQDLRKWRAEHEQQRKAKESSNGGKPPNENVEEKKENNDSEPVPPAPDNTNEIPEAQVNGDKTETQEPSSEEVKVVKKKRRALFPKIFMFLSRRRTHRSSSRKL
ncbi:hypothetical protein V6N13_065653 [Hibiscus sabdariffa]